MDAITIHLVYVDDDKDIDDIKDNDDEDGDDNRVDDVNDAECFSKEDG